MLKAGEGKHVDSMPVCLSDGCISSFIFKAKEFFLIYVKRRKGMNKGERNLTIMLIKLVRGVVDSFMGGK